MDYKTTNSTNSADIFSRLEPSLVNLTDLDLESILGGVAPPARGTLGDVLGAVIGPALLPIGAGPLQGAAAISSYPAVLPTVVGTLNRLAGQELDRMLNELSFPPPQP